MPKELDVWPLLDQAIRAGKRVYLPRFVKERNCYEASEILDLTRDLKPGNLGIREPNERCMLLRSGRVDLILVPGLAFDLEGHRLGRGKGYYDRLLAKLEGTTCGVAFDEQMMQQIPVEAHDVRLNFIITPTRWTVGLPEKATPGG